MTLILSMKVKSQIAFQKKNSFKVFNILNECIEVN